MPLLTTGSGKFAAIAGSSTDTFNSADKNAGISLDATKLIATSTGSQQGVRTINSHTTGKYHFEATVTSGYGGTCQIGIASGSQSLSAYVGPSDTTSWAMGSNHFWYGNNGGANLGFVEFDWRDGDLLAIEIDLDGKIARCKNLTHGSAWSSDIDISYITGGPWYIMYVGDAVGMLFTLNTGGSAYSVTPTSGFANNW